MHAFTRHEVTRNATAELSALAQNSRAQTTPPQITPVPVAVARPVANLVAGMLRPAIVLAAHSAAVVLVVEPLLGLDTDGGTASTIEVTRVVTLLTREASGVPNGVRTALSASDRPFFGVTPGDAAFVGAGGIRLQDRYFHAVRTIRTDVPHVVPTSAAIAAIAAAAFASPQGVPSDPVDELRAAIDAGDAARLRLAVHGLVGLGTGSTPGGDDVLAGTLAGLKAIRRELLAAQIAAAVLPDLNTRTPLMSADLLRLAAAGHVCTEAGAVLRATAGPLTELDRALSALLAVGHTSGADLATGIAIGLAAAAGLEPRKPRRSRGSTDPAGANRRAANPTATSRGTASRGTATRDTAGAGAR